MANGHGGPRPNSGRKEGSKTKSGAELRALAQVHTVDALKALASILVGGEGIPPAAQVAAAKELLDRGYGKSTQPISGDDDGPPILHKIIREVYDPRGSS